MAGIEIERWSFWSPESCSPAGWLDHWQQPGAEPAEGNPPTEAIPPMQRRRMSRLARMALSCALDVASDDAIDYSIFCSQHGEISRTCGILASISKGEELSPAAFAQSVHNTSSGLFTILTGSNHASTSLAAGASTFSHGWMEAQGYLAANPGHKVLLVDFDEVLPEPYRPYSDRVECDHALALILRASADAGIRMQSTAGLADQPLPLGPQFLAWLETRDEALQLGAGTEGWRWER